MSGLFAYQRQQYLPAIGWCAHIQAPPSGHPGCSRHETCPSTTFYPDPSAIPRIPRKPQAVYLRFSFRPYRRGRGMAPKRSRWAGFVAGGPRGRSNGPRQGARPPRGRPPRRPEDPNNSGGGAAAARGARPAGLFGRFGPDRAHPRRAAASFSKIVLASPSEFPYSTSSHGGVAQLGERLTGSQEVRGSIPLVSTRALNEAPTQVGAFFHIKTQGQRRHHDPSGRQD